MALRPRTGEGDPIRWFEFADAEEAVLSIAARHLAEHGPLLGVTATVARLRAGLPVVTDGHRFDLPDEFAVLEPSGAVEPVSVLREDGRLVDFYRRDGSLIGYSDPDAPRTVAELVENHVREP